MEKNDKRTLFFLKSPKHNLNAIENFLKKRDFNVVSISDYKEAVGKVIPLNPEYIFLAWDHPQEQVMNLPKLLNQSCTSKIIPYINTSDKHQHRNLQSCGMDPKLFPPLSGPGIQRMVAKIEQAAAAAERSSNEPGRKEKSAQSVADKKSEMIQVRSTFSGDQAGPNSKMNRNESTLLDDEQVDQGDQSMFREKTRADQLRDFQQGLQNFRNKTHTTGTAAPTGPKTTNFNSGIPGRAKADVVIQDRLNDSEAVQTESISDLLSSGKLSDSHCQKINMSYLESVKLELQDYLGNYEDIKASYADANSVNIVNPKKHYCIVIQSAQWAGYLILSSEIPFERQSLEFILSKWVYENFGYAENQAEDLVNTSPLFEISMKEVPYLEFSQKASALTTTFEYNNQKMVISFFNVDPVFIFLRLHEKFDMIKLGLAELPFEQVLEFDVCLYMPENERFLTYSKKNSKIQKIHLDRLKEKKVVSVYSSYENEVALQKFRAENQMNIKIEDYLKGHKVNETA